MTPGPDLGIVRDAGTSKVHIAWGPSGAWLGAVSEGSNSAVVYDMRKGHEGESRSYAVDDMDKLCFMSWSSDGQYLTLANEWSLAALSRESGEVAYVFKPKKPLPPTPRAIWSPDNCRLLIACQHGYSGQDLLVNTASWTLERNFPELGSMVRAWSPDGSWVAVGDKIYDTDVEAR